MVISKALQYSIFIWILIFHVNAKVNEINFPKHLVLSKVTLNLISTFFEKSGYLSITINVAMSNNSNFDGAEIGNEILKGIREVNLRTVVRGHQRKLTEFDKRRSPIVLILDSIDAFNNIKLKLRRIYPKYYLIVLAKGMFKEVDEIIKEFWSISMINVNFLVSNGTHGLIYTYFPFDHEKCGTDLLLQLINVFDLKTEKWNNSNFYPEKVLNLNNCILKIGVTENVPMVMINKEEKMFNGIEVLLIRTLGLELNFIPKFIIHNKIGFVTENNSSGVLGCIYERKCDVAIGSLSLQIERTEYLSATSMYASLPVIAVIPPSKQISPFEKLYLPFDFPTWFLLLGIFIIGFAVIILTRIFSNTLYKLIVGHKVNFPFTNMLIAFFGGSQTTLPKANFSRFLLAKFLLFCLVIRGLYQGKLFDIMKKDIYEKTPTTFDDLINKDYIFYTYESLSQRVKSFKFANRVRVIKNSEIEIYRHKTLDSSFNGIVFSYEPQVIYSNLINRSSFTYLILKERFVTNQMVFYLQENHFLAEQFHEKIDWFREFGITNFILSEFIDSSHTHKLPPKNTGKPLSFHELSAIFIVWFTGLCIASTVCVLEKAVRCKKSLIKKIRRIIHMLKSV